jgi:predicted secreted protein
MLLGINWFTAFVLFVIVWWTVLFAVLPIGTKPVADADQATGWRGAPERPRMRRKFLLTTAIAILVWGLVLAIQASGVISFRTGWLAMPDF